jgi:hypothetical protein
LPHARQLDDWRFFFEFDLLARVGSFLRFACAIFSSSFVLIELAMLFDAPRSELFDFFPRFAASAAPAAICCFLDFAGILQFRTRAFIWPRNEIDTRIAHVHNLRLPIQI